MFINDIFFKLRDLIENSPAKRDRFILTSFIVSVLLAVVAILIVLGYFWNFKDYIVLHYNIYFGISSLGSWLLLLLLPLSSLLVLLLNGVLILILYLKQKILSYFLSFASVFYGLIVFAAVLLIIYINI